MWTVINITHNQTLNQEIPIMNESRDELLDVHQRENMDALTVKVLVALNGGGAIALLTFSSKVMGNESPKDAAFMGILILVAGLAAAVLYNVFRRQCSLAHAKRNDCRTPCICHLGNACRAFSLALFVAGAALMPLAHLCCC